MFVNSEHTAIIVCFRNIDIKEKVLQPRFNYGEILSLSFGTTMKNSKLIFVYYGVFCWHHRLENSALIG